MKRIEATFRPAAFGAVKAALQNLGIEVINLSRSEDMRRRRTDIELPRGERRDTSISMVRIEVVVADAVVAIARDVIIDATQRASPSAGKILISSLEEAIDLGGLAQPTNKDLSQDMLLRAEISRREVKREEFAGDEPSFIDQMNEGRQ
jgi:nitrogen regulatory protein PII